MSKAYLQMGITASLGTMVLLAVALLFSGCGENTEGDVCTLNAVQGGDAKMMSGSCPPKAARTVSASNLVMSAQMVGF